MTKPTHSHRLRTTALILAVTGTLTGTLAGCSAPAPRPVPTPPASAIVAAPGHPSIIISGIGGSVPTFDEVFAIPVLNMTSLDDFRPATISWGAPTAKAWKAAVWQAGTDGTCTTAYEGPDTPRGINIESVQQKSDFVHAREGKNVMCEEILAYGSPKTVHAVPAQMTAAGGQVIHTRLYVDE